MIFVSNTHMLLKLNGGKAVTLMLNGCILPQQSRIQHHLEDNSRIVGESQIFNCCKTVLLEQRSGYGLKQVSYITLQFSQDGKAELAGIFPEPKKELKRKLSRLPDFINMRSSFLQSSIHSYDPVNIQRKKTQIKYAKEFFLTERGEVVKMAAIVSQDPEVIEALNQQAADLETFKHRHDSKHALKQWITIK